jgi:hypothetical protein
MAALTPEDFVSFMEFYLPTYGLSLGDEPPQATTYTKTEEFTKFDFPHINLSGDSFYTWNLQLKEVLERNIEADGFVAWFILEKENESSDQALLVIYDKETNSLRAYLSEKDLDSFAEVSLLDELPHIVDDYSIPLKKH